MDPVIDKVLDQSFTDHHVRLRMIAERTQDSAGFIKSRAEEGFLHESRLVGAAAAARLDRDQLAHEILQQRSAADQPKA